MCWIALGTWFQCQWWCCWLWCLRWYRCRRGCLRCKYTVITDASWHRIATCSIGSITSSRFVCTPAILRVILARSEVIAFSSGVTDIFYCTGWTTGTAVWIVPFTYTVTWSITAISWIACVTLTDTIISMCDICTVSGASYINTRIQVTQVIWPTIYTNSSFITRYWKRESKITGWICPIVATTSCHA